MCIYIYDRKRVDYFAYSFLIVTKHKVNPILHFFVGLLFVKVFTNLTCNFDDYRVIIAIGCLIEFIISLGLSIAITAILFNL